MPIKDTEHVAELFCSKLKGLQRKTIHTMQSLNYHYYKHRQGIIIVLIHVLTKFEALR